MTVRRATMDDLEDIAALLMVMHKETPLEYPPIDMPKMMRGIMRTLSDGVAFVAVDKKGAIVGSIGLQYREHWFGTDKWLGDLWFFVQMKSRKSPAGIQLLRIAAKFADGKKIPLFVGVVTGENVDRKDALYERLGFVKTGSNYVRGL